MFLARELKRMQSATARSMMTLVTGSFAGQLIALLVYPVLTRMYSPSDFGVQSVFLTAGFLLSILATGRYEQAILLPREDSGAQHLLRLVLGLALVVSLLVLLPVLVCGKQISALLGAQELQSWLYLLPLYIWIMAACAAFNQYANRLTYFRSMSAFQLSQSAGSAGFRLLLPSLGAGGLILGTILGQLTGLFSLGISLRKKISPGSSLSGPVGLITAATDYKNFPAFKMPGVFIAYFSSNLPVFFLTGFFSPAVSGLYALAYTTVYRPVTLFVNSIAQVFAQQFIQSHNEGRYLTPTLFRYLGRLLLYGTIPFLLAFAFAPWLFSVIFGKEWLVAGEYLRWMLPWLFMVYLYSGLNFIPDMFGQQRTALGLDIILLVLRILALGTGVLLKDSGLAILLFCLAGTTIPLVSLLWYIRLVRASDRSLR